MKVLAIGATGSSAGLVVPALAERGVTVRALLHDPSRAEQATRAGAAETVVADLTDFDSLVDAATGVDAVFGIIPAFSEERVIGVNMVRAAEKAKAGRFVFSSVYHPSLSGLSNHRDKQPAEEALYDSDLDFTVLQPAIFMQQLAGLWRSAEQDGSIGQPWSADARMAYVDYRDVAEVAAESFVTDRFLGGTFELSAPGTYTRHDIAGLMSEALGRPVTAETPSFDDWAARMPDGPVKDGVRVMAQAYDRHGFHGGNGLILSTLLDRPPSTVSDYIRQLGAS